MDTGSLFGGMNGVKQSPVTNEFIKMEQSCGSENRGANVYQKLETGIKRLRQTK